MVRRTKIIRSISFCRSSLRRYQRRSLEKSRDFLRICNQQTGQNNFWPTGPKEKTPEFLAVFNFVPTGDELNQRFKRLRAIVIILCRWHIIIVSPLETHYLCYCAFRAVVQCSAKMIPHWGTILTSTPAGPMFAANFCPTGTEVRRPLTSPPLVRKSIFVPIGDRFSLRAYWVQGRFNRRNSVPPGHNFRANCALVEMVSRRDTISRALDLGAQMSASPQLLCHRHTS